MALAVNRTGVILEKRDLSCHRPQSAGRCATASYQHTWPANTIDKRPHGFTPRRSVAIRWWCLNVARHVN